MRFKLKLDILKQNRSAAVLPLNYQYETSSWIYRVINYGDEVFSEWLHNNGYALEKKSFKLFTFSNFIVPEFRIEKDRLIILSNDVSIVISFYPIEVIENFVKGIFQDQTFSIGDRVSRVDFKVRAIEKLPEPVFTNNMEFKCLSPMVVAENTVDKYAKYLSPNDETFSRLFIQNLGNKANAFSAHKQLIIDNEQLTISNVHSNRNKEQPLFNENEIAFISTSDAKSRLITVKSNTASETKIRGFLFNFELTAPPELMKIGYYAGFGEKNSLGFGCCELSLGI